MRHARWAPVLGSAVLFFALSAGGCSHPMEYEWASERAPRTFDIPGDGDGPGGFEKRVTVAIEPKGAVSPELVRGFANALAARPHVRKVNVAPATVRGVPPSSAALEAWAEDRAQADYVVLVRMTEKYEGSGWNFLICWPGLIVLAQVWHGYEYHATLASEVDIVDSRLRATKIRDTARFDITYTDADRGVATGFGLFYYTAVGLIMAPVMCTYDPDGTRLFRGQVAADWGDHLATKVLTAAATTSSR